MSNTINTSEVPTHEARGEVVVLFGRQDGTSTGIYQTGGINYYHARFFTEAEANQFATDLRDAIGYAVAYVILLVSDDDFDQKGAWKLLERSKDFLGFEMPIIEKVREAHRLLGRGSLLDSDIYAEMDRN